MCQIVTGLIVHMYNPGYIRSTCIQCVLAYGEVSTLHGYCVHPGGVFEVSTTSIQVCIALVTCM